MKAAIIRRTRTEEVFIIAVVNDPIKLNKITFIFALLYLFISKSLLNVFF